MIEHWQIYLKYHQRMGILLLKKSVNRDKCSSATKQRMFGVFAIDEIFCYQGSRFPAPNLYATLNSINPREADELEQQMEKDTAMLESLQIEKREKMNKKKEAEIELEKEKRRLEKLDSKIRLFEQGDLNDDQLESRTYSEVD